MKHVMHMLYIANWCAIWYHGWVHRIIVILITLKCLKFLSMTETISLFSAFVSSHYCMVLGFEYFVYLGQHPIGHFECYGWLYICVTIKDLWVYNSLWVLKTCESWGEIVCYLPFRVDRDSNMPCNWSFTYITSTIIFIN